jgi:hypothetical protein
MSFLARRGAFRAMPGSKSVVWYVMSGNDLFNVQFGTRNAVTEQEINVVISGI